MKPVVILTCEHGGKKIPPEVARRIKIPKKILSTHQGYDIGAFQTAKKLASKLQCPLIANEITRLVIDFNRSLHHRDVFSRYSMNLEKEIKNRIIEKYYLTYRNQTKSIIQSKQKIGFPVLHLSIHSFTPSWKGKNREADIGILYNPKRKLEKEIATKLTIQFKNLGFKTRRNFPYKGIADGFTTCLRKHFTDKEYAGIEIEINQDLFHKRNSFQLIADSIALTVQSCA